MSAAFHDHVSMLQCNIYFCCKLTQRLMKLIAGLVCVQDTMRTVITASSPCALFSGSIPSVKSLGNEAGWKFTDTSATTFSVANGKLRPDVVMRPAHTAASVQVLKTLERLSEDSGTVPCRLPRIVIMSWETNRNASVALLACSTLLAAASHFPSQLYWRADSGGKLENCKLKSNTLTTGDTQNTWNLTRTLVGHD